jgi:hypothetical protein
MTHHPRRKLYAERSATCQHGNVVCSRCIEVTDAGKRMSGIVNITVLCHAWEELRSGWMAFKLEDGSSDGTLYDTREDAVNHQLHETLCAYLCMGQCQAGMNPRDAQLFLNVHRQIYDAGGRFDQMTQQVIYSQYGYDVMIGRRDPHA